MCDVLIPALIGVAALGLLGNGGTGCDNCPTGPVCAVTQVGNETITIPQLAGEGTNVIQVSAQDYAYQAPQPGPFHQAGPAFHQAGPAYQQAGPAPYQPAPAPYQGAPNAYGPYGPAQQGPAVGHYDAMSPAPYQAPAYQDNVGASINYDGQSAVGVGTYSNPNGAGIGANIGDASIGLGAQSY